MSAGWGNRLPYLEGASLLSSLACLARPRALRGGPEPRPLKTSLPP